MDELMPFLTSFAARLLCFVAFYLLGYHGIGIFTILFSLVALYFCHVGKPGVKVSSRDNETKPWWLQDANVGRVEWTNLIIENVWTHFDNFLSTFIAQALDSKGN